ncbi:mechanosensitive ion channel family protein [Formicincola oecophyllae]|uniref:Mechanosensitive ion channel family protein n=1 Tax=Formicincola oecophyllae TaxID=2558361 RepID=A0A4Y6U8M3_9PROT|nr:mechanosensitive ion channel family protein [Formicincola oecophyllae]QDH13340.1 mechanosensitive ion channel family protein [Formicincola oecophyllae]
MNGTPPSLKLPLPTDAPPVRLEGRMARVVQATLLALALGLFPLATTAHAGEAAPSTTVHQRHGANTAQPAPKAIAAHDASANDNAPDANKAASAALAPAQAQQLLSVLDNPGKRQELVTTLKNLAAVQKVQQTKDESGLLDQLQGHASRFGAVLERQSVVLTQGVANFSALGPWFRHLWHTPALQNEILRIVLRVLIVIVGGLGLAWGLSWLLRKPRLKIEEAALHLQQRQESAERRAHAAAKDAARQAEAAQAEAAQAQQTASVTAAVASQASSTATKDDSQAIPTAAATAGDSPGDITQEAPQSPQASQAQAQQAAQAQAHQEVATEDKATESAQAHAPQEPLLRAAVSQYNISEDEPLAPNVAQSINQSVDQTVSATSHDVASGKGQSAQTASPDSQSTASAQTAQQQAGEATTVAQNAEKQAAQAQIKASMASAAAEAQNWETALLRMVNILKRVPYGLGCLGLDLLTLMAFPLVAFLLLTFDPTPDKATIRAVWSITWMASVTFGVWVALLRLCLAPGKPWMRLIPCSDSTADFFFRWLKRLGNVASWGISTLVVLEACTVPATVEQSLTKLIVLSLHILVAFMIFGSRGLVRHACEKVARHTPHMATVMHIVARIWWVAALFFDFGLWLVWAMDIQGGYQLMLYMFFSTCVALIAMRVLSILLFTGMERLLTRLSTSVHMTAKARERLAYYTPYIQRVLNAVLVVATILVLAVAWGVPLKSLIGAHSFGAELASSALSVGIAILVGVAIWEVANILMERQIKKLENDDSTQDKVRIARLRTLQPLMRIILMVGLSIIIGLTVLSELGVNTGPLLAGASIFGVALGFGTQKLVQDFISGIFLLLENALTVGDAVTLNGTYGIVEKLSLRTVHVRGNDGSMNIFPFSSLNQTINYNRQFGRAIIIAEVAYDSNIDNVIKALFDITASMRADPEYGPLIIDDFQLWGVDSLNDSSVTVRGTLPTIPTGRWPVQRQFNKRMLKVFAERGIDFPFPTRTLDVPGLEKYFEVMEDSYEKGAPRKQIDPSAPTTGTDPSKPVNPGTAGPKLA